MSQDGHDLHLPILRKRKVDEDETNSIADSNGDSQVRERLFVDRKRLGRNRKRII